MAAISQAEIQRLLAVSTGQASYGTVNSSVLKLMTANGSATANGTEVSGGSYAAQAITWAAPTGKTISNSAAITFTGMPAATVVGVEIWDTGTNRKWFGALSASRTTAAGDSITFAAGSITLSLDV